MPTDTNPTSDDESATDHPDRTTADHDHDQEDENGWRASARRTGGLIGDTLGFVVVQPVWLAVAFTAGLANQTLLAVTRPLPGGTGVWRALHTASVKGLKRSSGADVVGYIGRQTGEVQPEPMKWKPAADHEEEGGRWHALSTDEEFNPGILGQKTDRIGSTPVAFFDEDDPFRASWLEARVAEAVDLGQGRPLYTPDEFNIVRMEQNESGGQATVADGGNARVGPGNEYQVRDQGVLEQGTLDAALEDYIIDLASGEDAAGMRISWDKVDELQEEKSTTEEMQTQEMRGRIAEAGREGRDKWMKILLYFLLAVIAASMGPELVAAIFGSGAINSIGSTLPI